MKETKKKRICLWSGPRNISTALMYAFAQREDTLVFDEPLYAHYLKQTTAKDYHPGAEDILASMENDGSKVVEMMMGNHDKPVVFFKNMTHHLLDLDRSFMKNVVNIILTRDPMEMLPSFAKVIENPSMNDVGYEDHMELLNYFKEQGIKSIVLDSKQVLLNPEKVLKQLCQLINIPFDAHMLKWEAGKRPEDGVWSKYWYGSVHKSTGFQPYQPTNNTIPKSLEPLLESCLKYYKELEGLSIR